MIKKIFISLACCSMMLHAGRPQLYNVHEAVAKKDAAEETARAEANAARIAEQEANAARIAEQQKSSYSIRLQKERPTTILGKISNALSRNTQASDLIVEKRVPKGGIKVGLTQRSFTNLDLRKALDQRKEEILNTANGKKSRITKVNNIFTDLDVIVSKAEKSGGLQQQDKDQIAQLLQKATNTANPNRIKQIEHKTRNLFGNRKQKNTDQSSNDSVTPSDEVVAQNKLVLDELLKKVSRDPIAPSTLKSGQKPPRPQYEVNDKNFPASESIIPVSTQRPIPAPRKQIDRSSPDYIQRKAAAMAKIAPKQAPRMQPTVSQ